MEQLLVVLVPIVGIVAFLWFADREIISSVVSFLSIQNHLDWCALKYAEMLP